MATDKIQTGLRLDAVTLNKITALAKRQKRSLNAQIEYAVQLMIEDYERQNGVITMEE